MTHSTFSRRLEATDANQTGRHGGAFVKFPFNPKEVCILTVHFSSLELSDRRKAVAAELADRGLDGLLMFRQESMYYLTGYDTFGYVFFQCLYMGADGETMMLLTRTPDLRQARHTSVIEDIRLWHDAEGVNPAEDLRRILAEHGLGGKRLGIETDAYGLTGFNLKRVEAAFGSFCELVEASDLVTRLRMVKSPAEIEYVREAARLADLGLDRAADVAAPGAFEGDVLAALQGAIFKGGGDFPANEIIIGSGPRALLFRSAAGMRRMDQVDQLSLEWAGSYRHYHAAMMRTIAVGEASDYQCSLHSAVREAIEAMTEALSPGRPVGEVDDAHRRVLDAAGLKEHRFAACGYALGTTFSPNWMDKPMLYSGNPVLAEPGMVFFLHCIVTDSDRGIAMSLGYTCLVTDDGREVLSKRPLDMIVV
jgi:Xaa-Pro dipeptidase